MNALALLAVIGTVAIILAVWSVVRAVTTYVRSEIDRGRP